MKMPARHRPGRPRDPDLAQRRRAEILTVAGRLFAERGLAATDLDRVARELGVGKGTIYRYFHSKEQLFLAAVDRGMTALSDQIHRDSDGAGDPLERVALAVRAYLSFFDANPWIVELLMQERAQFKDRQQPTYFAYRDANVGRWREVFRSLIRAGRVRAMPVSRITDVMSDLLYGTIFANHFAGRRKSYEAQARDILDVLFHGFLTTERPPRERAR